MLERQRVPSGDRPKLCGQVAISGLTALIADAVQSADDERVTALDRILRDVEELVDLIGTGRGVALSIHEMQAPFTSFPKR